MYAPIGQWEASSLSQELFCRNEGIKLSVFWYWRAKYLKLVNVWGNDGESFERITPNRSAAGIEISYPNGVLLRLPINTP